MGEFSPPPFSEPPSFGHADAQTSNTSTSLWFYYIITKIHPPFQNPGSAPGMKCPREFKIRRGFSWRGVRNSEVSERWELTVH